MFAVVYTGVVKRRGFFKKLKRAVGRPHPFVERIDYDGSFYYRVLTDCDAERTDWQNIARLCGKCARNLLLPSETALPPDCGCARFDSSRYEQELLTEAAVSVIEQAAKAGKKLTLGLVDIPANQPRLVMRLLEYAETVRVLTARVDEYDRYAESVYRRLGVAPVVGGDAAVLDSCSAVLAPQGFEGIGSFSVGGVIFAPRTHGCIEVVRESISLPQGTAVPDKIEPFDFAAACWQLMGKSDYIGLPVMLGIHGGAPIDTNALAQKI